MIITKRSIIHTAPIFIICILAAFLRLHGIADHTEFLADQGSAGVVIYEWYKTGVMPLVGPTTSTGQRPGPAYYYIIALPFILSNFNPVAPAIAFALFGVATVYLLYTISRKLWGEDVGLVVSVLYAVSPMIVAQNRNMWNPTLIPFFITVLIIAMYRVWKEGKYRDLPVAALCVSILIQLHYSNLFTLGVWAIFFLVLIIRRVRSVRSPYIVWGMTAFAVFIFIQLPFLWYQYNHSFGDVRQIARMFIHARGPTETVYSFTHLFYDLSSRLMGIVVPIQNQQILFLLCILMTGSLLLLVKNHWSRIVSLWLIGGIVFASRWGDKVFDHYMYFLYPLPFLSVGAILSVFRIPNKKYILWFFLGVVCVLQLSRSDVLAAGLGDIARTQAVSDQIVKESAGQSFSFTVISSRSFSDYHYRFFFTLAGITPTSIYSKEYTKLFFICESSDCVRPEDLLLKSTIEVMCYDHHCGLDYPKLVLADFIYDSSERMHNATLYRFLRR